MECGLAISSLFFASFILPYSSYQFDSKHRVMEP
jgi:hypothetical protein